MKKILYKIDSLEKDKRKELERQRQALNDLEECTKKIAGFNEKVSVQEQAVFALHGAVGALSNLATIMLNASTFWASMQLSCEQQTGGKLQKLLGKARNEENLEKRMKVYKSPAIKRQAYPDVRGVGSGGNGLRRVHPKE